MLNTRNGYREQASTATLQYLFFSQQVYQLRVYLVFDTIPVACGQRKNRRSGMILQSSNCRSSRLVIICKSNTK